MKPSVQVIIPTRNRPDDRVIEAVLKLTYRPLNVISWTLSKPVVKEDSVKAKYINAAATRNAAREELLKRSKATHYLWIDDDVVVPPDTVEQLLFLQAEAAGGWYPVKGRTDRWVAGRWAAPGNKFVAYRSPRIVGENEPDSAPLGCQVLDLETLETRLDPCRSDLAPLGCLLITRAILELIPFRPGVDSVNIDAETGKTVYLGDCGAFGDDLIRLGEWVKMSHRVWCGHMETDLSEGRKSA